MDRSFTCVFCEDIREEKDGRVSLIGVFQKGHKIIVSDIPGVLPKFSIYIEVYTPAERPLRSLSATIALGDKVQYQYVIDDAELLSAMAPINALGAIENVLLRSSPFHIDEEGQLLVRISTDDGDELIYGPVFCLNKSSS